MRERPLAAAAAAAAAGVLGAGLALPAPAWALKGPAPGAATAATLKLPDKPASVHGLSDAASVEVFSGQIAYDVPIELPPGPGGLGPSLALSYSGDLGNGSVGIGWRLSGIAVRRSQRQGVPRYDDFDELDLVGLGHDGRLIRDPAIEGRYWVEGQGHAVRVDRLGNHFEVYDGSGTHYFLGVDAGGIEGVAGKILGWYVQWIQNPLGQRVQVRYLHDANQIYLSNISWGPNNAFTLDVGYQARPDVTSSYRGGYLARTVWRANTLTMSAFHEVVRAYDLSYDDTTYAVSRLQRVHMRGRGGNGALPDLTFTYVKPDAAKVVPIGNLGGWVLNERGVTLLDVDGDGMSDLAQLELGNHMYRKNLGGRFAEPRALTGAGDVDLAEAALLDVDGDARADLVHVVDDGWRVARLVGEQWQPLGAWAGTQTVPLHAADTVLADINGDGRADVIRGRASGIEINFGRAGGLTTAAALPRIQSDAELEPGNPGVRFVDMNGDGLADVAWMTDAWMKILLGRGDGTFVSSSYVLWPWVAAGQMPVVSLDDLFLADLNRDGLVDLVRFTAGNVVWYPGLTDGRLSGAARAVERPESAAADVVVAVADIDGNGSEDVVWSSPRGMWALDLAGSGSAGMLASIANGLGKTTTFSYSASALLSVQAELAGRPWEQKLPVSIPVPVQTDIDPGGGGPIRTVRYGIRDGYWDGQERRFGGFLESDQAIAAERNEDIQYQETFFNAGLGTSRVLRGKPRIARVSNGRGDLLSVTVTNWEAMPVTGLPASPLTRRAALRETVTSLYEGTATPQQIRTNVDYDGEVRPTVETRSGTALAGDEAVTNRFFASDDTYWVRDQVYFEEVIDGMGRLASRSQTYFGGPAGDPLPLGVVGMGLQRRVDGFLASEARWVTQSSRAYDACGNATSIYDSGVSRSIGYDGSCLHPTNESVVPRSGAAALAWSMTWDNVIGQPLALTDPNGDTVTVGYDGLGRQTTLAINNSPPHIRHLYDWVAPQPRTTSCTWDGALAQVPATGAGCPGGQGWRTVVEAMNGAGDDLFSSTTLRDGRFVIAGWRERDDRGLVALEAESFYTTAQFPSARPASGLRVQVFHHDALGRQDLTTMPNGATKRTTYLPLQQTVERSGLAPVTSYFDGLDRVVRTERAVETGLESVDAYYDAAGRILTMSLQTGPGEVDHTFIYDSLGRLRQARDPDAGLRDLTYDDRNLLREHRNGAGQSEFFDYDLAGRLIRRGETPTASPATDYAFVYDDPAAASASGCRVASRLAAVIEPGGDVHSCYDVFGRASGFARSIVTSDGIRATGSGQQTIATSGLQLTESFDDGLDVAYRYDAAGRLVGMAAGGADVWVADEIDAAGRVVREHYGNGATQSYQHDGLGVLSRVTVASPGGASLYDVSVTRNPYGAPTIVADNDGVGLDQSATFTYDSAGRIVAASEGRSGPDQITFTYAYDVLQNMIRRRVQAPKEIGILAGTYRYGERGYGPRQLTSVAPGTTP